MKLKLLFLLLVIVHHCILLGLLIGSVVTWITQPWYMALLYCVVVLRIATIPTPKGMRDLCVLTQAEAALRAKLGYKPLKGFVKHYYILPAMVVLGKIKTFNQRLLNAFKHS